MSPDLNTIQRQLSAAGVDGWLLTDFRGSNAPARRILSAPACSRRWWVWIPAEGEVVKLEPAVEVGVLSALPGTAHPVSEYGHVERTLTPLVAGKRVAMEYSPAGENPYVAHVDAGTIERVRGMGAVVVSSQNLLQHFEARWSLDQFDTHLAASRALLDSFSTAANDIAVAAATGKPLSERQVTDACAARLRSAGMLVEHLNTSDTLHSRLPHYDPPEAGSAPLSAGCLVLMDHFCKLDRPGAVYADYTRVFYLGQTVPPEFARAFDAVVRAREAAVRLVESAARMGRPLPAREVDLAAREQLIAAGYQKFIAHRTGHNLGSSHVHGFGAHLDAVEHPDTRLLIPQTAFTIEPGLYFPHFGVRTEINIYLDETGHPHLTGHRPDTIESLEL